MAHIVILGAGTGGMPAAYELREKLDVIERQAPHGRGRCTCRQCRHGWAVCVGRPGSDNP